MVQDNDAPGAAAPLLADQGVKPWYQSRTIIGAGIMGGSVLGGLAFGLTLDAETQRVLADQVTTWIIATSMLGGTVLAIVGRFKAEKAIGKAKV
ncbi:hypothetical protein [Methylobacterium flocculans]|uniref:hypothetical protein n=1 Tax=Methylobacterium flocculans TaxID=2984843 RepID=UPI0021F36393|nr:hypothetical protein [Methylobacterium sp. FF17]